MFNSLNVPLHYAGYISVIIAGGTVISSIFSERIIRRFGTGIVTVASTFMTAAAIVGFSFSHSFFLLCVFAIPLGFGAGSVDVALNNYVALHFKARHMSWLHCFWGIGASAGPLIMSSFLIRQNSWNAGYGAIGIIQFCLVILLIVSLPLWKNSESKENTERNNPVKFSEIFRMVGVKEVLIAFFCHCSIEITVVIWGASYLVIEKGISPEIAAKWIALYYVGLTFGRFISGFATIKLNNRRMIRLGQIILACGIIVLVLPFWDITLLPGLFVIGLGCAPIFPSLLHSTPENFGREHSQAIMGVQMGSAYIGTTIMPPIFGWFASHISFGMFPIFIGVLLIILIIMAEVLNRKIDSIETRK